MGDRSTYLRLMRYGVGAATFVLVLVVVSAFGLRQWHAYQYPFGWSHCCDKALGIALISYAIDHGRKFPSGGATPEASLSLLFPKYDVDANVLRGKTVPLDVVQRLLEAGQPLTPDTCGWHYVDGLVMSDRFSSYIAILWDKVGLDHNGGRLPHGGHTVLFMDGGSRVIRVSDWDRFLSEQQKAWNVIRRGEALTVAPWVPEDR